MFDICEEDHPGRELEAGVRTKGARSRMRRGAASVGAKRSSAGAEAVKAAHHRPGSGRSRPGRANDEDADEDLLLTRDVENARSFQRKREAQRLEKMRGKQSVNGRSVKKGRRPVREENADLGAEDGDDDDDDDDLEIMGLPTVTASAAQRGDPVEFKPDMVPARSRDRGKEGKRSKPVKLGESKVPLNPSIVRNLDRIICNIKGQRKQHERTRMRGGEYGFMSLGNCLLLLLSFLGVIW